MRKIENGKEYLKAISKKRKILLLKILIFCLKSLKISDLFKKFEDIDFYLEFFHLQLEKLIKYNHPINTQKINTNDLKNFQILKIAQIKFFN